MKKILMLVLLALATLLSAQIATVTGLDPNGDGFLSLRAKPKGKEIGKLYNGNKVKILKKKGKYYKVKVVKSGMVGYAHGNWIRKSHTSNSSNTSTSHKQGTVHGLDPNGDGFLSLRNKPKGREIGKLYNGDRIDILATRGKWYKVKLANSGQVGWAHGNWVKIDSFKQKEDPAYMTRDEAYKKIVYDHESLKKLPKKFRKDKYIIYEAVKNHNDEIKYIDDSLKKDKVFMLTVIFASNDYGSLLKYMDDSLKKDKNIVYTAVRRYNDDLEYADDSLKKDKDFMLSLVKGDKSLIEYADDSLKKDKDFMLSLIKKDSDFFYYADDSLRKNKDVILAALKNNETSAIRDATPSLLNDKEFLLAAHKYIGDELFHSVRINDEMTLAIHDSKDYLSNLKKVYKTKCDNNETIEENCYELGNMHFTGILGKIYLKKALYYYEKVKAVKPGYVDDKISIINTMNNTYDNLIEDIDHSTFYIMESCKKVYGYGGYTSTILEIKSDFSRAVKYTIECTKNLTDYSGVRITEDNKWFKKQPLKKISDYYTYKERHTLYKITKDSLSAHIPNDIKEQATKTIENYHKNFSKLSDSEKERLPMIEAMLTERGFEYKKVDSKNKKRLINFIKNPITNLYNVQGYKYNKM